MIPVLLFLLTVAGSTHAGEALAPVDYAAWVEDESNGLKVRQRFGDNELTLQYKPPAYVVVLEEKTPRIDGETLARRTAEIEDFQYFTLILAGPARNQGDPVQYFAFGMQADLALRDGVETLPCRLFHYEPGRSLKPATFVLAFPLSEREKSGERGVRDKTLIYDARFLGGPAVELTIRAAAIAALPRLRTH